MKPNKSGEMPQKGLKIHELKNTINTYSNSNSDDFQLVLRLKGFLVKLFLVNC